MKNIKVMLFSSFLPQNNFFLLLWDVRHRQECVDWSNSSRARRTWILKRGHPRGARATLGVPGAPSLYVRVNSPSSRRGGGPRRGRAAPLNVETFDPPLRSSKVDGRKIHWRILSHVTFPPGGKLGTSQSQFVKPLVCATENRTQNGVFWFY